MNQQTSSQISFLYKKLAKSIKLEENKMIQKLRLVWLHKLQKLDQIILTIIITIIIILCIYKASHQKTYQKLCTVKI